MKKYRLRQPRQPDAVGSRRAFTLIELLVTIAIIGVLAALIIPAVQRARESSRRSTCVNNLKQLALACLNYESTHRRLPSGYIASTDGVSRLTISPAVHVPVLPQPGSTQPFSEWFLSDNWSWHALILHHLGQSTIALDLTRSKGNSANLPQMATRIPTFVCPSMSDGGATVFADLSPSNRPEFEFTNYRGVAGTNLDYRTSIDGVVNNGVMYRDSATGMQDLRDGASGTLLLAETVFGLWGDGHSASIRAADDNLDGRPDWGSDGTSPSPLPSAFDAWHVDPGRSISVSIGSWHDDTANAALADGSVRSLSKAMEFQVLAAMCTRAGAERVQMP